MEEGTYQSHPCKVPEGYRCKYDRQSGTLTVSEHSGTVWLWAYPKLLLWDQDLVWLFSPVNDRSRWTGDLWGLDRLGRLLIVENKKSSRKKRTCDPLSDFVSFDGKGGTLFEVHALTELWQRRYEQEMDHIRRGRPPLNVTMPGVLPYSSKRSTLFRWRDLYDNRLANWVGTDAYRTTVKKYLAMRFRLNKTDKFFPLLSFGVITVTYDREPALTHKDTENFRRLRKDKPGHVHLVALKAITKNGKEAVVEARRLSATVT